MCNNIYTRQSSPTSIHLFKVNNRKLLQKLKLRSLGMDSENFGKLLVPVLNSKHPPDMRTLFARKISGKVWEKV